MLSQPADKKDKDDNSLSFMSTERVDTSPMHVATTSLPLLFETSEEQK